GEHTPPSSPANVASVPTHLVDGQACRTGPLPAMVTKPPISSLKYVISHAPLSLFPCKRITRLRNLSEWVIMNTSEQGGCSQERKKESSVYLFSGTHVG
ncbi:hypothetical protein COCVIDRAFT_101286, partial [Bipolaris victoriae FI3]